MAEPRVFWPKGSPTGYTDKQLDAAGRKLCMRSDMIGKIEGAHSPGFTECVETQKLSCGSSLDHVMCFSQDYLPPQPKLPKIQGRGPKKHI